MFSEDQSKRRRKTDDAAKSTRGNGFPVPIEVHDAESLETRLSEVASEQEKLEKRRAVQRENSQRLRDRQKLHIEQLKDEKSRLIAENETLRLRNGLLQSELSTELGENLRFRLLFGDRPVKDKDIIDEGGSAAYLASAILAGRFLSARESPYAVSQPPILSPHHQSVSSMRCVATGGALSPNMSPSIALDLLGHRRNFSQPVRPASLQIPYGLEDVAAFRNSVTRQTMESALNCKQSGRLSAETLTQNSYRGFIGAAYFPERQPPGVELNGSTISLSGGSGEVSGKRPQNRASMSSDIDETEIGERSKRRRG